MAFATAADVAGRLGRNLTIAEATAANAICAAVTGLIADTVGRSAAWAAALNPVPITLSQMCVEKALQTVVNPHNVASVTEQIGSYQYAETYPRASDIGVFLSEAEERRVRRIVHGSNIASVSLGSILN